MAETETKINDITFLQGEVNDLREELKKARRCWREEFDKRKQVEKVLKELGQGTGFLDVEKLRKDITEKEMEIFNTRETIRTKTEAMQTEKAIDQGDISTERDGLRTLKKQCEQAFKNRKKELDDALKKKRHEMTIDDELREEADMTKKDWEKEVKVQTAYDEEQNKMKLEGLRLEQEKNIKKQEDKIQTIQDDFDKKYGACEEEIRKLKTSVEKMKIQLHDLEMARENRLVFAELNNRESVMVKVQEEDEVVKLEDLIGK